MVRRSAGRNSDRSNRPGFQSQRIESHARWRLRLPQLVVPIGLEAFLEPIPHRYRPRLPSGARQRLTDSSGPSLLTWQPISPSCHRTICPVLHTQAATCSAFARFGGPPLGGSGGCGFRRTPPKRETPDEPPEGGTPNGVSRCARSDFRQCVFVLSPCPPTCPSSHCVAPRSVQRVAVSNFESPQSRMNHECSRPVLGSRSSKGFAFLKSRARPAQRSCGGRTAEGGSI